MSKFGDAMQKGLSRGKSSGSRSARALRLCLSPTWQLFVAMLALSAFRLHSLDVASREMLDCQGCLSTPALVFELRYLLLAAFVHFAGHLWGSRGVRWFSRMIVCGLMLLYVADLVLLKELHVRLTLQEVVKFSSQFAEIGSYSAQVIRNTPVTALLASGLVIVLIRYLRCKHLLKASPGLALFTGASVVLAGYAEPQTYHLYYLQNPLEALLQTPTRNTPYTPAFHESFARVPVQKPTCLKGQHQRPNIVMVVIESLSMPQSQLFSGMQNWTPELDALTAQGLRLSSFYANGVTTEQGLVSILTGEPPIEKGRDSSVTVFEQFSSPRRTIPRMLNALGYQTAFLTTGNLSFLNKGTWLSEIGFSFVEGHEADYYAPYKRYAFDAAPDDALYARGLQQLTHMQQTRRAPIFAMLETVTTHAPYVDPASDTVSQEKVVRYADHALGDFVRKLAATGFFENGYVMVLGDHRAMIPASAAELSAYGDRAYARVPFAMIGKALHGADETREFSQSDLLPSLQHWLSQGIHCYGPNQGLFLPTMTKAPACVFTRRSYAENNVYVQCGVKDYTVALDGDSTDFVSTSSGPTEVLQEIHRLRLNYGMSHNM